MPESRPCWKEGCEKMADYNNGSCMGHSQELERRRRRDATERGKDRFRKQCAICRKMIVVNFSRYLREHSCAEAKYHQWHVHERAIAEGITLGEAAAKFDAEREARKCPTCHGTGYLEVPA